MYKTIYVVELLDENYNTKKTLTVNFNYSFFKNLLRTQKNMIISPLDEKNGCLKNYKKYYFKNSPKRRIFWISNN